MIPQHQGGRMHVGVLFQEASDRCTDECGTGTVCFEHMTERLKEVADKIQAMEDEIGKLLNILTACSQQDCSCYRRGVTLCGSCRARDLIYPIKCEHDWGAAFHKNMHNEIKKKCLKCGVMEESLR